MITLGDDDHPGIRRVRWQVEAIAVEGEFGNSDTGAFQLRVLRVPCLNQTTFGLNAVVGFQRVEVVELALVELAGANSKACTRQE